MSNRSKKAQVWIGVRGVPEASQPAHSPAHQHWPARVLVFKVLERRGGGWHPVTGGVEASEEYLEGAKRELEEETGFRADQGTWIDLEYSYHFEGRFGKAREHAFGFILPKELAPVIDPSEHLAFEWVSVEEAMKRLQFEPQRDALMRFLCYLR